MELRLILARRLDVEEPPGSDEGVVVDEQINVEAMEVGIGIGGVATFRVGFEHPRAISHQDVLDGIRAGHAYNRRKRSRSFLQYSSGVGVQEQDAFRRMLLCGTKWVDYCLS
jgi:hypothetical protein